VPEVPAEPVSRPGDLFVLGDHRLLVWRFHEPGGRPAPDGRRARRGDDHRPTLSRRLPGGDHPASEANQGDATKDKHWDTYIDHEHSVAFYVDFLRTAIECALAESAAIYQCFGIMRTEVIWQAWRQVGLLPTRS